MEPPAPKPHSRTLRHAPFALLFALAALLRLYGLGWLPGPAGDEGNWTWIAFRLSRGTPAGLDPDASFVSLLFARLMAASMTLFGPTFFTARLVGVTAVLLALVAVYALLASTGSRRAGLAAAGVLAFHPWSVLWSRTASVPYALALACGATGATAFAAGAHTRRPWLVALGIQALALGAHFSPLAIVPTLPCALLALRPAHRWILRDARTWFSVTLATMHTLPLARAAARVARAAPPRQQFDDFATRLASYLHTVGSGLAGEATIRHFTHAALPYALAGVLAVPIALLVLRAARTDARRASPLGGFGPLALAVGLVAMPLVLAPARAWQLARIDAERYLFALLPAFALCVADVACLPGRVPRVAAAGMVAWLLVGGSGRAAWAFLRGGGPDRGLVAREGGGAYRGWRVAREHESPIVLARDTVRALEPRGATILVADYTFHPLHFANATTNIPAFDVNAGPIPPRANGSYFFLLWDDAMLATPGAPRDAVLRNAALRERMHREFRRPRLVRRIFQPNGFPLVELWRAERASAATEAPPHEAPLTAGALR